MIWGDLCKDLYRSMLNEKGWPTTQEQDARKETEKKKKNVLETDKAPDTRQTAMETEMPDSNIWV